MNRLPFFNRLNYSYLFNVRIIKVREWFYKRSYSRYFWTIWDIVFVLFVLNIIYMVLRRDQFYHNLGLSYKHVVLQVSAGLFYIPIWFLSMHEWHYYYYVPYKMYGTLSYIYIFWSWTWKVRSYDTCVISNQYKTRNRYLYCTKISVIWHFVNKPFSNFYMYIYYMWIVEYIKKKAKRFEMNSYMYHICTQVGIMSNNNQQAL